MKMRLAMSVFPPFEQVIETAQKTSPVRALFSRRLSPHRMSLIGQTSSPFFAPASTIRLPASAFSSGVSLGASNHSHTQKFWYRRPRRRAQNTVPSVQRKSPGGAWNSAPIRKRRSGNFWSADCDDPNHPRARILISPSWSDIARPPVQGPSEGENTNERLFGRLALRQQFASKIAQRWIGSELIDVTGAVPDRAALARSPLSLRRSAPDTARW